MGKSESTFVRTANRLELKRKIAATDVAIDALAYELYGLIKQETAKERGRN